MKGGKGKNGKNGRRKKVRRGGKSKGQKQRNSRRYINCDITVRDHNYYHQTSSRPEGVRTGDDDEDNRLEGASIYPSDLNYLTGPTSALHPWLCSLRTRGFRGRHRCGVTLLSGPTEASPRDPFVLVGTAHCNYICKDRVTGDPLETCCCRPVDNDSSCKTVGQYSK